MKSPNPSPNAPPFKSYIASNISGSSDPFYNSFIAFLTLFEISLETVYTPEDSYYFLDDFFFDFFLPPLCSLIYYWVTLAGD